jgi:hypothetical protein
MSLQYTKTHTVSGYTGGDLDIPFTFDYLDDTDIKVYRTDTSAAPLVLGTDWQFKNKKEITLLSSNVTITNGDVFLINRETQVSSPYITYAPGSSVRAEDLNSNQNQVLYSAQEREERSLNTTGGPLSGDLDMQTNKIVNLGTPTANADASTKAYVDGFVGLAGGYASQAQASAAAALLSETAAGLSETSANTDAGTATTQAGIATAQAGIAAGHASTASGHAGTASTDANTASTQAGIATTQAGLADTARIAAESARDSALAAFDNFDDVYLGEKTADPTVDNDGDPLNGGDLYYRSTAPVGMKVYTGSAWVSAYVPGDAANITSTATGDVAATNVQDAIAELDTEKVPRTSTTGSAKLPVGNTTQRDTAVNPADLTGYIRYNTTDSSFEGHNGTSWGAIGGGATGAGGDAWALEHDNTVTTSYTIGTGKNVVSAGPLTINSGATVTVPSGSTWVIV